MKRAANSAGDALWKMYSQPRRAYSMGGVSAPSSRRLWDIVKKDLLENHDAKHVTDIWMEVWKRSGGEAEGRILEGATERSGRGMGAGERGERGSASGEAARA